MSEPVPESIPTSADPRSRRPTKKTKTANTASAAQNLALEKLFEKQPEINIPTSATKPAKTVANLAAPPEIVANVQGSSAGAGSGEFHVYKAGRRREYERLRLMEEESQRDEKNKEWEQKREEMKKKDEAKTSKNQKRRAKQNARKGKKDHYGDDGANNDNAQSKLTAGRPVDLVDKDDEVPDGHQESGEAEEQTGITFHDDD